MMKKTFVHLLCLLSFVSAPNAHFLYAEDHSIPAPGSNNDLNRLIQIRDGLRREAELNEIQSRLTERHVQWERANDPHFTRPYPLWLSILIGSGTVGTASAFYFLFKTPTSSTFPIIFTGSSMALASVIVWLGSRTTHRSALRRTPNLTKILTDHFNSEMEKVLASPSMAEEYVRIIAEKLPQPSQKTSLNRTVADFEDHITTNEHTRGIRNAVESTKAKLRELIEARSSFNFFGGAEWIQEYGEHITEFLEEQATKGELQKIVGRLNEIPEIGNCQDALRATSSLHPYE